MRTWHVLKQAIRTVVRRPAMERELENELQSYVDEHIRRNLAAGMSRDDAEAAARRLVGSVASVKDACRDTWRPAAVIDDVRRDVQYAWRTLSRDRTFTLMAIAMLGLAIGLNVTVFTVMDAMLFRGFPLVKRNDRLVYLQERYPSGLCCVSYRDFEEWRAQAQAFEGMAFVAANPIAFRDGDGRPMDMVARTVSANTFGLLGVAPMLGRDFVPADEVPGAAAVAILNYGFWESRFGKRADIVGSTVHINGAPGTIIGVMPEGFDFPVQEDLWMPLVRTTALQQRGLTPRGFMVVGRLRDGASLEEARTELETINRRLEAAYPATNRGVVPTVATHAEITSGQDAPIIWGSLWAGACFVLLIACANLANFLLVRTMGRWREFATRIALGAGQGRMIRQILVESLMLVGVAGVLGWAITVWSVRTWTAVTASRYQVLDYTLDSGTLAYLAATCAVAVVLCSLAPIGRVVQVGVGGALKGDPRGVTQGLRGKHLAAGLAAGQMALAIVLLAGAGVLVRSFVNIVSAETGVRHPERILVGSIQLPSDAYPSPATRVGYFDRIQARLRTIPGIEDESVASTIPVKSAGLRTFEIEERPGLPDRDQAVGFVSAGSDYFRVVGAAATSGREFNDGDHHGALPVAIVNQSFADRFWPGELPVGKRLRATKPNAPGEWRTVVGVVPNIMQGDPLRQQFRPLVYVPFQQEPAPRLAFFLVRTAVPADQLTPAVRAEVLSVDPDVVLDELGTLKASFAFDRDFMDAQHSELGKYAKVAPAFALIALLLSAIGLTAVIAHSVTQRTKEIGVRIAVGAASHDIRRLVFREGMLPVAVGLILGFTLSLAVNRILQSQLVGVSPYDPVTLAAASAVLMLVALFACDVPARRALRINPVVALQHE